MNIYNILKILGVVFLIATLPISIIGLGSIIPSIIAIVGVLALVFLGLKMSKTQIRYVFLILIILGWIFLPNMSEERELGPSLIRGIFVCLLAGFGSNFTKNELDNVLIGTGIVGGLFLFYYLISLVGIY